MLIPVRTLVGQKNKSKSDAVLKHSAAKTQSAVVSEITAVEDNFVLRCTIKDFPAVVGINMPVRIAGVVPPKIVQDQTPPNKFYQSRLKKFLKAYLLENKNKPVILKNITRAPVFCFIADIEVAGKSLAQTLIAEGLAQKADADIPINLLFPRLLSTAAFPAPAPKISDGNPTNIDANTDQNQDQQGFYVAAKNSKVFHRPDCKWAKRISPKNKIIFKTRQDALNAGRRPCKVCKP